MSTNDVPGFNSANNDTLAMGAWAEHADGSMIFVESTEGGRVIYCMFDLAKNLQYRDATPEPSFKKTFSWDPKNPKSTKWTWHDKTPFPWDKVIGSGFQDGQDKPSADAAIKVADDIKASRARHFGLGGIEMTEQGEPVPFVAAEGYDDSAAGRVAKALDLEARTIDTKDFEHLVTRTMGSVAILMDKMIDKLNNMGKGKKHRRH